MLQVVKINKSYYIHIIKTNLASYEYSHNIIILLKTLSNKNGFIKRLKKDVYMIAGKAN